MTGSRKRSDDHSARQWADIETREAAGETYAERVARDLEHQTGEESPAIKLLSEWKAGHPDREWCIQEDFAEKRGIMVSLRSGDTQYSIPISWPSPWLSRDAAHRATAEAVSKLIDAIRVERGSATFFHAAEPEDTPPLDVAAPPGPQETPA